MGTKRDKENYSPQMSEKTGLKWLSLATVSILGQAPVQNLFTFEGYRCFKLQI